MPIVQRGNIGGAMQNRTLWGTVFFVDLAFILAGCGGLWRAVAGCGGQLGNGISPPQCGELRPVYTKEKIVKAPLMSDPVVSYIVDEHAIVHDVVIKQFSGSAELDDAALNAAKKMHCTSPAMDGWGHVVSYEVTAMVKFGFRR
ncbi:energy transducer TonB [Pandoraea sp. ISTKB]|uniref:energy transducer TonB n=1 Tax=Pandoraea sp. ISTKB TaxID=1586708 RepID=UPI000847502C|nr:hypothetical protein [Pandoraea sp. ISTKB]ODP33051.1 hypothetical protein A9762_20620 [Pandoraea sp. ISTKB]